MVPVEASKDDIGLPRGGIAAGEVSRRPAGESETHRTAGGVAAEEVSKPKQGCGANGEAEAAGMVSSCSTGSFGCSVGVPGAVSPAVFMFELVEVEHDVGSALQVTLQPIESDSNDVAVMNAAAARGSTDEHPQFMYECNVLSGKCRGMSA